MKKILIAAALLLASAAPALAWCQWTYQYVYVCNAYGYCQYVYKYMYVCY